MTLGFDFGSELVRRLPIYLLVDVSESMVGEPLQAVNHGIRQLFSDLQDDPVAVETAYVSVITFANRARQIIPLREVLQLRAPDLTVGPGTSLGAAFELLSQALKKDLRKTTENQRGDYKPIIFLMTDGVPTDDWRRGLDRFRSSAGTAAANIIAIGCGEDADLSILKTITPNVMAMKNITSGSFREFFKWVSASVTTASVSASGAGKGTRLPAPPAMLEVVGTVSPTPPAAPTQYIFAARCRKTSAGYLIRYRASGSKYRAVGAYPVSSDYFAEADTSPSGQSIDAAKLEGAPACPHCGNPGWRLKADKSGIECHDRLELSGGQAQVLFVLDVTGSMAGEIDGVRDNIGDFVDYIQKEGLSAEVGLIAFRDLEMREPPKILKFSGGTFTSDTHQFKRKVAELQATGGGGNPGESSYDALALACRQPFKEGISRVIILITDEPPLLPDGEIRSVDDVVSHLRRARIDQLHIVVPKRLYSNYQALHDSLKGDFFELSTSGRGGGSFRNLLLNIGRSIAVTARVG